MEDGGRRRAYFQISLSSSSTVAPFGIWHLAGMGYVALRGVLHGDRVDDQSAGWRESSLMEVGPMASVLPIASNIPKGVVTANFGEDELGPRTFHRTDAGDYIGRIYREKGLGKRVCQIYCDSRDWDTSNYPADFFDSVLIDGGHQPEVVINDTRKSLQVLRPGGLIMWHDFCPFPEIRSQFESVKGVTAGIETMLPELQSQLKRLCWINPSWILVGIKR